MVVMVTESYSACKTNMGLQFPVGFSPPLFKSGVCKQGKERILQLVLHWSSDVLICCPGSH